MDNNSIQDMQNNSDDSHGPGDVDFMSFDDPDGGLGFDDNGGMFEDSGGESDIPQASFLPDDTNDNTEELSTMVEASSVEDDKGEGNGWSKRTNDMYLYLK